MNKNQNVAYRKKSKSLFNLISIEIISVGSYNNTSVQTFRFFIILFYFILLMLMEMTLN